MIKRLYIILALISVLSIHLLLDIQAPKILYLNTTSSMPKGLYLVEKGQLKIGDTVIISPLKPGASSLVKVIYAKDSDVVCWHKGYVSINGNQTLPLKKESHFSGCTTLKEDEFFVATSNQNSFDSRYFGPVKMKIIKNKVRKI